MDYPKSIKIDGKLMYGTYNENQLELIEQEMIKPKNKRKYLMGIEFSLVDNVEVID